MAHFCQRSWQVTGESYQAFVPTTLDDQMVFTNDVLSQFELLDNQIKAIQKDNCTGMDSYFNRYITGGNSLRDGRLVSRKRLALAAIGLSRKDEQAQHLIAHGQSFAKAVHIGSKAKRFCINALAQMAEAFLQISGERKVGAFRRGQGWIGGTSPVDAYYVAPPVEMVELLIEKLCDFINRDDIPASLQAAIAHMQLLIIHPFGDGNGRMARALVEVILRRRGVVTELNPPMFLYRLAHEQNGYMAAIKDFEQEQYDLLYDYWLKANDWALSKAKQLNELKQQFNYDCNMKLTVFNTSNSIILEPLLANLFDQPIVTSTMLSKRFCCSESQIIMLLKQLAQAQIIKPYQLKEPLGAVIWDAPKLFELMAGFDQQLFLESTKKSVAI